MPVSQYPISTHEFCSCFGKLLVHSCEAYAPESREHRAARSQACQGFGGGGPISGALQDSKDVNDIHQRPQPDLTC